MNSQIEDKQIDQLLNISFDASPEAIFETWRKEHGEVVSLLNQERTTLLLKRRKLIARTMKITATAALLAAIWLGISQFAGRTNHNAAYAENALANVAEQINKAKTITWRTTYYSEWTSYDKKTKWIKTETRQNGFREPGLFSDAYLDKNGNVLGVEITDNLNLKELWVDHTKKEATLRGIAYSHNGFIEKPFSEILNNQKGVIEWVETKTVDGRKVNIFRRSQKGEDVPARPYRDEIQMNYWSEDYWLDAKTKKLIRTQIPGADIFEIEKELAANRPPKNTERSLLRPGGCFVIHDFVFNADVDDSLFNMIPPKGYTLTTIERPTVSEDQMIEYLHVLAEYFDNTFPDSIMSPRAISTKDLNLIWAKKKEERTGIEQKLIDLNNHYISESLYKNPFWHFIHDHTVKDTWRYLGKGVKVGEKDRIVCWYKPLGKSMYRAVYGDLSVKDIAAEDLPFKVKP